MANDDQNESRTNFLAQPQLSDLARRPSGQQQWLNDAARQMTHSLPDPRAEDVARRLQQTGRNFYETWFGPAQRLGRAATSGTLDVTSPSTVQDALHAAPWAATARMPVVRAVPKLLGEGEQAISAALDRMTARGRGNEWISVPEGGQGIYMRMRPNGIDIANLSFETQGTGAFTRYLNHIEAEAERRGLKEITMENIFNPRLIPYFEKRGYVMRGGDPPSMIKRIVPIDPKTGGIDIARYYGDRA